MSTPTPPAQTNPTQVAALTVSCLLLAITIVSTVAGFAAYRYASLITRHIELIFTRDTVLPILAIVTPPSNQPTSPTGQPKSPPDQPTPPSYPPSKAKQPREGLSDEAEETYSIPTHIAKYMLLLLCNRLILTDREGAFLALRSPGSSSGLRLFPTAPGGPAEP